MINKLLLPHIREFRPYSSARSEFSGTAHVFLDASENPFGDGKENRYPPATHDNLRKNIAEFYTIPSQEWIALGNGSDEILDLLVRLFCAPKKDAIITTPPTFEMYSVFARLNNIRNIEVPLRNDFSVEIEKILKQEAKILFLCSPNNPTGNLISLEKITLLCEKFSGIVVVDEAYSDFCLEKSAISLLKKYENLAIVKTFSKAWGLAGRRLGFLCASPRLVSVFLASKAPYNVDLFAANAALERIQNPKRFLQEIRELKKERNHLQDFLEKHPLVEKVFPSDANFLLVRFVNAKEIFQKLLKKGIVVRNFSKKQGLENCLRISIGSPLENKILRSFLARQT